MVIKESNDFADDIKELNICHGPRKMRKPCPWEKTAPHLKIRIPHKNTSGIRKTASGWQLSTIGSGSYLDTVFNAVANGTNLNITVRVVNGETFISQ